MDFKEKLNEYIEQLGCTSKELAQASGLFCCYDQPLSFR